MRCGRNCRHSQKVQDVYDLDHRGQENTRTGGSRGRRLGGLWGLCKGQLGKGKLGDMHGKLPNAIPDSGAFNLARK